MDIMVYHIKHKLNVINADIFGRQILLVCYMGKVALIVVIIKVRIRYLIFF